MDLLSSPSMQRFISKVYLLFLLSCCLVTDISCKDLLKGSSFADDLDHITNCFDRTTKPRFRSIKDPQYIRFGSARDNDSKCGIRFGQLKIAG